MIFYKYIKEIILFCIFLLGWLFVSAVFGVRYFYGDVDIALMMQHVQLIKTADLSLYQWGLLVGGIFVALASYLTMRWKVIGIPVLLIMLGYLIIPEIGFSLAKNRTLYYQHYTIPKLKSTQKPKNIIWISLESIEELFKNSEIIGDENLIPSLTQLQREGINFHGWEYLESMEPTIPSYIATNCGIPRNTRISSIQFRRVVGAYPKAVCMTDILKKNGYDTTFVMGGHIEDENANQFVKAHPFSTVVGRDDFITQKYSTPEHHITGSNDITPDAVVFEYAKNKITKLSQSDSPFFISIITANTHGPAFKYLESSCQKKYGDARDCIKCMDEVVGDFIKWCQKQPFYKDTVIFLIGDHPMFRGNLKKMKKWLNLEKIGIRETYNVVLDGSKNQPKIINRRFTQIDWAPTILESAGFTLEPHRLGLGVSLWSNESTLLEKFSSIEYLGEKLQKSEAFFNDFFYGEK